MKKVVISVLFTSLFLAGCGSEYTLHDDFEMDLNQVLEVLDKAYEENRTTDEKETEITEAFVNKYEVGQFKTDDEKYEMNDLEKAIVSEVKYMRLFTDYKETLASEKSEYEKSRDKINTYIKEKEVPEEFKGFFKTYELRESNIHPTVKEDTQELIRSFEGLVNGNEYDVDSSLLVKLDDFIKKYESGEFEVDEKDYLMTDDERRAIIMAKDLQSDLNEEIISVEIKDDFNLVKTVFGL